MENQSAPVIRVGDRVRIRGASGPDYIVTSTDWPYDHDRIGLTVAAYRVGRENDEFVFNPYELEVVKPA